MLGDDLAAQQERAGLLAARLPGLTPDQVLAEAARVDVDVRVLRPGDMMTADHRPARLNAELDADDRVARTWLG